MEISVKHFVRVETKSFFFYCCAHVLDTDNKRRICVCVVYEEVFKGSEQF